MTLGEIMWEATLIGLGLLMLSGFLWLCGAIATWAWLTLERMRHREERAEDYAIWMNEIRKALVEDAHRATAGLVEDDPEPPIMTLTPERLEMLSRALAS